MWKELPFCASLLVSVVIPKGNAQTVSQIPGLPQDDAKVVDLLEFYAAAGDGRIDYITTELALGNSSSFSSRLTWHNKEDGNRTALHVAASGNHGPVVLALLEAGASPDVKRSDGVTPVHEAALYGRITALSALLQPKYQAHVNQQDDVGRTPIYLAALVGHTVALKFLIAHGGNVNTANIVGWSPLMQATQWGTAQALINAGARLGDADTDGYTALHRAAWYNKPGVVLLLLQNGADKSQQDDCGHTPADRARLNGNNDLAAHIDKWQ